MVHTGNLHSERKGIKNVLKVIRSHCKIITDRHLSFTWHESFIDLLDIPEISGKKTKLQTSLDRTNPLTETVNEFIDTLVEREDSTTHQ